MLTPSRNDNRIFSTAAALEDEATPSAKSVNHSRSMRDLGVHETILKLLFLWTFKEFF